MVRHRRVVLSVWAVVLIACAAGYPSLRGALGAPDYRVSGSQSARVEQLLERRFPDVGSEDDALVFHSRGQIASQAAYRRFVSSVLAVVGREQGVEDILSPYAPAAVRQISFDQRSAVAVLALSGSPQRRFETTGRLQSAIAVASRASTAGVQAWLTGYSPVTRDLVHVQSVDVERAEAIGVPVAFLLLLIALGSLCAALIPLLLAGAGLLLTYGVLGLLIEISPFDNFLVAIVAMVGVGIGIDYALIIVSRFREELARLPDTDGDEQERVTEAVGAAIATAGRTILFSGVIVALAMLAMLTVRAGVFHEITVGVVAVAACTLLAALTLLPAVLGQLGFAINRGALPARMRPANASSDGNDRPGGWARWAMAVMRHPVRALAISAAILLLGATPALGLRYGLSLGVLTVSEAPSGKGEQILSSFFAPGAAAPMQIILTYPSKTGHNSTVMAARALAADLERDTRVAGLREQRGSVGVLLTVVSSVAVDSSAASALVEHLRRDVAPALRARWGTTILVGGATAALVDLANETSTRFPLVLALIMGVSLLFLAIVFRSPLLAIEAVLMNLLSTGAMLGVLVFVFQNGHGEQLLGFTGTGFIQAFVPLTVFALLFGLSMDYEVFLIRRIQEEWKVTHDNRRSIAIGVEHTARPIAAAAAIMVAVFGSFITANLLELEQLGFAVAVGIAVDATLIRLVLVPALMRLFGDWNWWWPQLRRGGLEDRPARAPPARP